MAFQTELSALEQLAVPNWEMVSHAIPDFG
jgi:hypothetical protein